MNKYCEDLHGSIKYPLPFHSRKYLQKFNNFLYEFSINSEIYLNYRIILIGKHQSSCVCVGSLFLAG